MRKIKSKFNILFLGAIIAVFTVVFPSLGTVQAANSYTDITIASTTRKEIKDMIDSMTNSDTVNSTPDTSNINYPNYNTIDEEENVNPEETEELTEELYTSKRAAKKYISPVKLLFIFVLIDSILLGVYFLFLNQNPTRDY